MNNTTKPLAGKIALVTGGSRGIGAAIARRLAADGATVALSYFGSQEKAEAVAAQVKAEGGHAVTYKADQGDAKQVAALVQSVVSEFGRLDILVNNAGIAALASVGDPTMDHAALDRQMAVNIGGVAAAVRAAGPILQDNGRIITIGSDGAERIPFGGAAEYGGSKAAVAAFSRGWARDLGPRGITVNTVQPGAVSTDMNPDNGRAGSEMQKSWSALGRYGTPEEVAAVVAFLAGPDASYVTGAAITVDGGVIL